MNQDLKIIKKYYGERMMRLCRDLFATIIENYPGMLLEILLKTFSPSHYVYEDIVYEDEDFDGNYVEQFKIYIYSIYNRLIEDKERVKDDVDDPKTLLKSVGYTLYECKSEMDIQNFTKYYRFDERLCTFQGNRLRKCYVYFAVRDDADKLKRSDFINPERQDEYGTSVLSIQFTRDGSHTLSIKNRYNHTVSNPDATFSNDLDKIVPGLTQSFADYYGMIQMNYDNGIDSFEMHGYVRADDGRLYKYNYEIDNKYFCPGNIIIDNYKVYQYDKEKYLVMDYFILDLINKRVINKLDDSYQDSFMIDDIKKIEIIKLGDKKQVTIIPDKGEEIIIILDKYNQIISYKNNNVTKIGNGFLRFNETLEELELNNVVEIGDYFLRNNRTLKKFSLSKLKWIGNNFLSVCPLEEISLVEVEGIGNWFMQFNKCLKKVNLPKVKVIGDGFLRGNKVLKELELPEVLMIGDNFLFENKCLEKISLPNVETIGNSFCFWNQEMVMLDLPKVDLIRNNCLCNNQKIKVVNMPKISCLGQGMAWKSNIEILNVPKKLMMIDRELSWIYSRI